MPKPDETDIKRRDLLTGRLKQADMDEPGLLHISSAIVTAHPQHVAELARKLGAMPKIEVHAAEGSKIILVLEGASVGEVGGRMAEISVMDRVISANLVFEQILSAEEYGERA